MEIAVINDPHGGPGWWVGGMPEPAVFDYGRLEIIEDEGY
jgi:hypothetical protein